MNPPQSNSLFSFPFLSEIIDYCLKKGRFNYCYSEYLNQFDVALQLLTQEDFCDLSHKWYIFVCYAKLENISNESC